MNKVQSFTMEDPTQWTIPTVILNQSDLLKDKIAIEFIDGCSWSFKDCELNARIAAAQLIATGVKAGHSVALMIDSPEEFTRYWLGLGFIGATMVAINTSMRGMPLAHQFKIAQCSLIITDGTHLGECKNNAGTIKTISISTLSAISTDLIPVEHIDSGHRTDVSCVMFTSGTSGPSKGVMMPQAHCLLFAIGTIDHYQLCATDKFYICLPLFHANGLFMQLLACLVTGCKAVVRSRFSASRWLRDIRQYKITHTNTLGAVAAFIVAQKETDQDKDHNLKVIGAAPLPVVAEQVFRNRFGVPSVVPLYGMTEVNIPLYGKLHESAPGTCGYVYDKYFEVEIRHPESDEPLPDNNIGEIMVRPKLANGFMSGYVGMPEATLNAWRNFWFHTGDAGYRNSQGQFVFVDRMKDCIRKRGENISSYEVEQAFLAIDNIAEVAAYAVPADGDEGMEDEVMIAVLLKDTEKPQDIHQWIDIAAINLPVFAVPRFVRVVNELPKTQTGKIRKVALREDGITKDTVDLQRPAIN